MHILLKTAALAGLLSTPLAAVQAQAATNAASPLGDPELEAPTMHSLGTHWIISGDDNKDAKIDVSYRKAGAQQWQTGPALFRVEKGVKNEKGGNLNVPPDAWVFAGSVVLLEPNTAYEIRLNLTDPDGGQAEKLLQAHTKGEPVVAANAPRYHVVPGDGGGSGTQADPYKGLVAAQAKAKPGDVFLLHAGTYEGTFNVNKSGEPGQPIVWRGAGDGEAIIDGQGKAEARPARAINANDMHDVWFENITVRNADNGLVAHNGARFVVRRCHIHNVDFGINVTHNDKDTVRDWFIADNLIEGPSVWPRSKGIEDARGVQITGTGHDVCYNRIRGFADAIDTFPSQRVEDIDFHHNDVSELTDDGFEMDYSVRNTRCFMNRLTNVYQGVSVQPIFGGPVYIFRNAIYNVVRAPFKMHNSPSGAVMLHNTIVKNGTATEILSNKSIRNSVFRNNLFIGTTAGYAFEVLSPMVDDDFDYDGFGGGPYKQFMKWGGVRYPTFDEMKAKAPVYHHATLVDASSAFVGGTKQPEDADKQYDTSVNDLRLNAGSAAVDAGAVLPGFNDNYAGKAPDLGAYELGAPVPHYGPRP